MTEEMEATFSASLSSQCAIKPYLPRLHIFLMCYLFGLGFFYPVLSCGFPDHALMLSNRLILG